MTIESEIIHEVIKRPGRRLKESNAASNTLKAYKENEIKDNINKEDVCVDILRNGFAQAFVDFFYLSHRLSKSFSDNSKDNKGIQLTESEINIYRNSLCTAESARRTGNVEQVYISYESLAQHFTELNNCSTAIFFYEKCLDLAKLLNDPIKQVNSLMCIGKCYEDAKDYEKCIKQYKVRNTIAKEMGNANLEKESELYLLEIYDKFGTAYEMSENFEKAIEQYKFCYESCVATKNIKKETLMKYKIGQCYKKLNAWEDARSYLIQFLDKSKELNDYDGQIKACIDLGIIEEELNNTDNAIEHLNELLRISTKISDVFSQAKSYKELGIIYNRKKNYTKSTEMFEKCYNLLHQYLSNTKSINGNLTRKDADDISVLLGMSRANSMYLPYLNIVNNDLDKLLQWKSNRVQF